MNRSTPTLQKNVWQYYFGLVPPYSQTRAPTLLDNTLLRNPNFVVVRIYLFFMVLISLVVF